MVDKVLRVRIHAERENFPLAVILCVSRRLFFLCRSC